MQGWRFDAAGPAVPAAAAARSFDFAGDVHQRHAAARRAAPHAGVEVGGGADEADGEQRQRRRAAAWWFVAATLLALLTLLALVAVLSHEHGGDDGGGASRAGRGAHGAPAGAGRAARNASAAAASELVCPPGRHAYRPVHSRRAAVCALNAPFPDGVDASIFDNATAPCDDFMRYACGRWLDSREPVDRAFREVAERNREVLDEIVRIEAEREWGHGALGTYVRACVGAADASDAQLAAALRPFHDEIDTVATPRDAAHMLGRLARYGFETPLYASVEAHPLEPARSLLLLIEHSRLDLDRAAMGGDERALVERIERALAAAASPADDAAPLGLAAYARERLARDLHAPDAVAAWLPLEAYTTGLGGAAWSGAVMAQRDVWVVSEPYARTVGELLERESAATWRALLHTLVRRRARAWAGRAADADAADAGAHGVHGAAPRVPWRRDAAGALVHARLRARAAWLPHARRGARRAADGKPNGPPREGGDGGLDPLGLPDDVAYDARYAACSREAEAALPGVSDFWYARMVLPHIDTAEVEALTRSVIETFAGVVARAAWLPAARRRLAADKLAALLPRVAVPAHFGERDATADLRLGESGYTENQLEVSRHVTAANLALLTAPRERNGDFEMRLSAVNAYFEPSDNTISLLAGILHPPFYSRHYDAVSNAASLGFVVGHEVGHALDPDGSQFGPLGEVLPSGLGPSAAERERYACLVDQYNAVTQQGTRIDGLLTLGENVADNTGLPLVYETLDARLRRERGTGLTRDEARRFFAKYAQLWCARHTPAGEAEAARDVHSPPEFRVNHVLRNMRAFRAAYGCAEGAPMAPARRCVVWDD